MFWMGLSEGASMEENHPEAGRQVIELAEEETTAGKCLHESKMMWQIAAPAMLTAVTQFSIDVVTAAFVGHLGDIELAAVSVVQNIVEGFVYGVMVSCHQVLVSRFLCMYWPIACQCFSSTSKTTFCVYALMILLKPCLHTKC